MRRGQEPAKFRDYIPTSTVPSQLRNQYLTKKQRSEAVKARMAEVQLEQNPEPTLPDNDPNEGGSTAEDPKDIKTDPDSFGVFRTYSSLPSHNPDDFDPFEDNVPRQMSFAERIGSDLHVSSTRNEPDPFANSPNPSWDLLLSWWSQGACDGVESLNRLAECLLSKYFKQSELKGVTAEKAMRQFEKSHGLSKSKAALAPGDGWKTSSVKILPRQTKSEAYTANIMAKRERSED